MAGVIFGVFGVSVAGGSGFFTVDSGLSSSIDSGGFGAWRFVLGRATLSCLLNSNASAMLARVSSNELDNDLANTGLLLLAVSPLLSDALMLSATLAGGPGLMSLLFKYFLYLSHV